MGNTFNDATVATTGTSSSYLSKLDAINLMLRSIGEAPVSSINTSANVDVDMAVSILDQVSRSVQAQGWSFNTDYDYPLTPNNSDEIPVPAGALFVDVDYPKQNTVDVTIVGNKLYNRTDRDFKFDDEIKATIYWSRDFGDLPEPARQYIARRAAREFQAEVLGSDKLNQFTSRDETAALAALQQYEQDQGDYSPYRTTNILTGMFRGGPWGDSWG